MVNQELGETAGQNVLRCFVTPVNEVGHAGLSLESPPHPVINSSRNVAVKLKPDLVVP